MKLGEEVFAVANRIKGITVEIGGDTTKLQTALKGVNGQIKSTQQQLKDVDKLLKLDPGNTELLAQKHKLLAEAVGETKEKLATLKTAAEQANTALANIRAYKVLDNGTLEARASKVTVNADGTLTLSAMSDGNSTYVFLYEPAKASEEHTHSFEWVIDKEATETEDGIKHEECACGEKRNENTVIPKTGTTEPNGLSTGAIVAIVIACVVVLAGGVFAIWWFAFKKKRAI